MIRSAIVIVMLLAGCSVARAGLGSGQLDGGEPVADGAMLDVGQPCLAGGCGTDAGRVDGGALDTGAPTEDTGTDSGMIVMDDAGTDAGMALDAGPPCPSPSVYSVVTGRCYQYIDPTDTCAAHGMELAWWTTLDDQHAIEALSLVSPGVRTDLVCTGACSSGYRWADHVVAPSPVLVEWDTMSPPWGVAPLLLPSGMYALDGSPSSRGYLCQSL